MKNNRARKALGWSLAVGASTLLLVTLILMLTLGVSMAAPAGDASTGQDLGIVPYDPVMINELRIDQSGSDNDEYFELMGMASASLNDKTYLVIGDGTGDSGTIESVVPLSGTVIPAGGFFLAAESTFSLGPTPDLTATLNFENSDNVTHMLVSNFTGSVGDDIDPENDGIISNPLWSNLDDCVALIESPGSGDLTYCPDAEVGPDGSFVPGQARYCPGGWQIGDFGNIGLDTPRAANTNCTVNINELRIDQPSGDNDEYFELRGVATTSLDTLSYLVLGDDGSGNSGVVENATTLTGTVMPAGNFFLAAEDTFSLGPKADLTTTLNFENSDNVTHMLVDNFTGQVGDVLDTNGDGSLDVTPWDSIDDCVALIESPGSGDHTYCSSAEVGPDGSFVPGQAYLCARGWEIGNFGNFDLDTPRMMNSVCPTTFIAKTAPSVVSPGEVYTYTLSVENISGGSLTNVMVRDTVPDNSTFAWATEGGMLDSGDVVWTIPSVANLGTAEVSFAVTATTNLSDIVNSTYSFTATQQVAPISGEEVVTTVGQEARIHDIQGESHISPLDGKPVTNVPGIVTVLDSGTDYTGFYMQDPNPDAKDATSEGIFVFTDAAPTVSVGDAVLVNGIVYEFRAVGFLPDFSVGPGAPNNLTISRIVNPVVDVVSTGNKLPAPTIIGSSGRMPPTEVIDNDTNGDIETDPTTFDPANDGIDFYESLEGMLVQVNDAVVVGPTRSFGDISVLGDGGKYATGFRTDFDGLIATETDFNPERIILTDDIGDTPEVNVGDTFSVSIQGVIDYSFGNYKLLPPEDIPASDTEAGPFEPESSKLESGDSQLTIATFNVENLDPGDGSTKFNGLADIIVNSLNSPDIIALQEVQDNNGTTDDGTVDASDTYAALIAAIDNVGGPDYDWRDIAPVDNADGGAPGGNIRVGYLFNPERVEFVDRGNGGATDAVTVTMGTTGVELSLSPGRIDPTNSAWVDSRKSLAAEFIFNDVYKFFLINNHWKSKTEDDPLFGRYQPPVLYTEPQRLAEAQSINDFVDAILALNPEANVVVLGDLNEFQFRPALSILEGDVLTNTWSTVPISGQYSYIFDGNSQVLDHILLSESPYGKLNGFDAVHVNADMAENSQAADHDPLLIEIELPAWRYYFPYFPNE